MAVSALNGRRAMKCLRHSRSLFVVVGIEEQGHSREVSGSVSCQRIETGRSVVFHCWTWWMVGSSFNVHLVLPMKPAGVKAFQEKYFASLLNMFCFVIWIYVTLNTTKDDGKRYGLWRAKSKNRLFNLNLQTATPCCWQSILFWLYLILSHTKFKK